MLRPQHFTDVGAFLLLNSVELSLLRRVQQHSVSGHVRIVQNTLNQLQCTEHSISHLRSSGTVDVFILLHTLVVLQGMEECTHTSWRICLIFGQRGRGMK